MLTSIGNEQTSIALYGDILPHKTIVVSSDRSDEFLKSMSQIVAENLLLDGASTISLLHDGKLLDILGDEGIPTPLNEIDINNLNDEVYASSIVLAIQSIKGIGLRRDELIQSGSAVFLKENLLAEWVISSGYDLNNLGRHFSACAGQVVYFKNSPGLGGIATDVTESFTPYNIFEVIEVGPGTMAYDNVMVTVINMFFNLTSFPAAMPNDGTFITGTYPFAKGLSGIEVETIRDVFCDEMEEGYEVTGFRLGISGNSNVVPSSAKSEIIYGIYDCIMTDTKKIEQGSFSLYPTILNSSQSKITITSYKFDLDDILLFSMSGTKEKLTFNKNEILIPADLEKGVYFLMLKTAESKTYIRKFIKI